MATASTNFSHKIEERKREEHALVTHGIYAYLRHPAYFGFFWWSIGTQVLLGNPIAVLAYTGASWHFLRLFLKAFLRPFLRLFLGHFLEALLEVPS